MLIILADDLTGALDSAAPFAARAMTTLVALDVDEIPASLARSPEVLSVNLGSREVDAATAHERAATALARVPDGALLFKKVDSRLKGNIGAELEAFSFRSALVAPAIPEFGRVVRNGHVEGFGVDNPIPVADLIGAASSRAYIPDTMTQADMVRELAAGLERGVDLLVGARGLAEALAAHLKPETMAAAAPVPAGPALFVIGSRDPITLAQVKRLRSTCSPSFLPAPNGVVSTDTTHDAVLTLVQALPGEIELSGDEVSRQLASSVHPHLTEAAKVLLLSGGATAEAVLQTMGVKLLELKGECLPGLALAYTQRHCIIAKSGGFGGEDTLSIVAQRTMRVE
jgi:uncharacterized protein YgbK (DUF1537 family)